MENTTYLVDVGFIAAKVVMLVLSAEGLKPVQKQALPPVNAIIITASTGIQYTIFPDGKISVYTPDNAKKHSQLKFPL